MRDVCTNFCAVSSQEASHFRKIFNNSVVTAGSHANRLRRSEFIAYPSLGLQSAPCSQSVWIRSRLCRNSYNGL